MALGDTVTNAVLEDWRTAPIDDAMKAVFGYMETMTLTPEALTVEHARAALDAGLSPDDLRDAVYVCALFNMIVRLADTLDFHIPDQKEWDFGAWFILKLGYRF